MPTLCQFSTFDLFAASTYVALALVTPFPDSLTQLVRLVVTVMVISAVVSFRFSQSQPCTMSIVFGVAFFGLCIASSCVTIWIEYFNHDPTRRTLPYFEDGPFEEGIVYPIGYFVFYAPAVMLVCLFTWGALRGSGLLKPPNLRNAR